MNGVLGLPGDLAARIAAHPGGKDAAILLSREAFDAEIRARP